MPRLALFARRALLALQPCNAFSAPFKILLEALICATQPAAKVNPTTTYILPA